MKCLLLHIQRVALCSLLIFSLSNCSLRSLNLDPDPLLLPPENFIAESGDSLPQHAEEDDIKSAWWSNFEQSNLNNLIEEGLQNNFSIMAALARLEQASAIAGRSYAPLFPQIGFDAGSRGQISGSGNSSFITAAGAALNWELDFFGRLYSAYQARTFEETAAGYDLLSLRLIVSSRIAETFFLALEQREQLQLLKNQVDVDRELLELTELRFKGGLVSSVDVLQQRGQLADTESFIPLAEARLRFFENQLNILRGKYPDGISVIAHNEQLPDVGEDIFAGTPARLILERPDLLALRSRLIAADADINSAIAARFPSVNIGASYAFLKDRDNNGFVGSVFSGFILPLIDWGRRRAEVARNKALYAERIAEYTDAVLTAVTEVEDSLYSIVKQKEYIIKLEKRLSILKETAEETTLRYNQGLTDYLPVLDAIQSLRAAERALLAERRQLVLFKVQLYRTLGGPMPALEDNKNES